MITQSGGGALMTYSWAVLAPRSHWEYTKQMQTEGRMGEEWGRTEESKWQDDGGGTQMEG